MNQKEIITLCVQAAQITGEVRLDKFLHEQFPAYSRSYFQQLIYDEAVCLNGKIITKPSASLKIGDIITFTFPVPPSYKAIPRKIDFQVIDEQPDFLIINKPPGLVVHAPSAGSIEPTLVDGLLHLFTELIDFNDMQRPGIVHRLDKDTSGLMIIARTIPAQYELAKLFKDRSIEKTYLAATQGEPKSEGVINVPIGRHPNQRHKMAPYGIASREATTFYTVLKHYDEASLIAARIITGRTHQIRVHCASIGHKILGDQTYGVKSPLINRQALHSWKLAFSYKGKHYRYVCPVPEDFKQLLHKLNNL
ncbi:RluA family pseudouridine synthase [Candidatus Dependentiae bacterium]|nr:RluA family pseudouridine synthase [Candidatus Dependentiae bacterium]